MYRRFGARVTVVEYGDRLIAREDREVSREVQSILEREGIEFHFSVQHAKVTPSAGGRGIRIALGDAGDATVIEGSHLLAAVGRKPNTDDLGLDNAGIATDARGYIVVDDELRTSVAGVWALGDANGRGAFTHTSYNDYQIVADNLLNGGKRKVGDRLAAYALFTDPPLGRVGMGLAEAKASGRRVLKAEVPMSSVSRAQLEGETAGLMRVLVDGDTEEILGATILGLQADDVVQIVGLAIQAGIGYPTLRDVLPIHPTVAEFLPSILGSLTPLD